MHRLWEIILGLEKGFLGKEGEFSVQFNPQWPGQASVGAGVWNFMLGLLAVLLVVYVYRREGRSKRARVALAALRIALLAFVLVLLNRPVLTLSQEHHEPSVLPIVIDTSISMSVRDALAAEATVPQARLQAVLDLLGTQDAALLRGLAEKHILKFYRFDQNARAVASLEGTAVSAGKPQPGKQEHAAFDASLKATVDSLKHLGADGRSTQVVSSARQVLEDLQGQRVAGLVLLTDGRDTSSESLAEGLTALKTFGVKVYPIAVGSDKLPQNIEVQTVDMQDSAFVGDVVIVKANVRITGYEAHHAVKVRLMGRLQGDKNMPQPLKGPDGHEIETTIYLDNDKPQEVELPFKATDVGALDVSVEAIKQPGQLDESGNIRTAQIAVLDAKINVLYVDGYPRWEYRYVKTEMIREQTVNVSCLLLSADPGFAQEGTAKEKLTAFKYFPYKYFPETMEQLLESDVVIFGDVDPKQFSDSQLQLVSDFVSKKGGGFGMIAGPKCAPQAFRNTPIESILPVNVSQVVGGWDMGASITLGFRPVVTKVGEDSSIFRFYPDKARNRQYLLDEWQPIFWYCQHLSVKPGVGEAFAEHPRDLGPDGHKAPLLVLGRFGAGRTLFSAYDDSWRWRYYTGESIFNTYWVQQLRYLARSKKLGQRRITFTSSRPDYESGEQIRLNLRILDGTLLTQLPPQISVDIRDTDGQIVRHENLVKQEGGRDLYTGSFTADHVGKFVAVVPAPVAGMEDLSLPLEVIVPRLELVEPRVDRTFLTRLASETLGQTIDMSEAAAKLLNIPSAAQDIPDLATQPLWDAPLALLIFVLLITVEWVLRKVYGML